MTPRDLIAAFEVLADAPDGVKRLRELVLELAVRGKLVPQDPREGLAAVTPSSGGRPARRRTRGAAHPVEPPFKLPSCWRWVSLGDITHDCGSKVPDRPFTYIDVGAIDHRRGFVGSDLAVLQPEDAPSRARKLVQRGCIIYSTVRPYLLNIAKIELDYSPEAIVSTAFAVLHPWPGLDHQYLYFVLRSGPFIEYVSGVMKGVAYPAINASELMVAPVPLPPLAEQRRIVARVDELMGLLDRLEAARDTRDAVRLAARDAALADLRDAPDAEAVEAAWGRIAHHMDDLFTAPEDVGPLRQAVLQLAVRGRLVPQGPADEPASQLVARSRTELVAAGKKPDSVDPCVLESLPPLPTSWQWAPMNDLLLDIQAGWSPSAQKRPKEGEEWGVLKVSACSWGRFLPDENKALNPDTEPRVELEVQAGDLLISRANTLDLVARSVLVDRTPPRLMLSDKTLRLRTTSAADPRYLNLANLSDVARAHYEANATGTSASMRNVSQAAIRRTPVPLPPLAEQRRIVAKVDALMAHCDDLEAHLTAARDLHGAFAAAAVHHLDTSSGEPADA